MGKRFLALLVVVWCSIAGAQVQRMRIPAGVYEFGAVQSAGVRALARIPAYCIDDARHTPGAGTPFRAAADNIKLLRVSADGSTTRLPLKQAIEKGQATVEGTGDFDSLKISIKPEANV